MYLINGHNFINEMNTQWPAFTTSESGDGFKMEVAADGEIHDILFHFVDGNVVEDGGSGSINHRINMTNARNHVIDTLRNLPQAAGTRRRRRRTTRKRKAKLNRRR